MNIPFDQYLDNPALRATLEGLAADYPDIMQLESLGTSHEGRDIPLVIISRQDTGSHSRKPAFWVDANIHATEVTGTMAALKLIALLLSGYGEDARTTRMVDEQAFYIAPRLNPDGAALALAERPRMIRSGTRPFPLARRRPGLHAEDIDGDGRILQMRLADPNGDWRISDQDPRLMVKRRPFDAVGPFYRLFPEGLIEGYDGHSIPIAPPIEGLDFNRNFPSGWRPEGEQGGAGDYPGSEPEIQAVLAFIGKHRNIFGALTYHTFSRALLRPFSAQADDEMDQADLWVYEAIGKRGTELTGYPAVSVYHHFRYHPKETISGAFDDWMFGHNGVLAFTVELWDLPDAAGVEEKNSAKRFIEWLRDHPESDDEKILSWADDHAPGAMVDWQPFVHPQLGAVEIGGWDAMYSWRNPPHALLEAEITPVAEFSLDFASLAPILDWRSLEVESIGAGRFLLRAVVENRGFLSTSGSQRARKAGRARPVELRLSLGEGAMLVGGKLRVELGHLEGRSNKLGVTFGSSPTDNRGLAEWIIEAQAGSEIWVEAISDRAGSLRRHVRLGLD
jgi:murein tripeptide amidase MpaA